MAPNPPSTPAWTRLGLWAVLLLALALRIWRAGLRWDEITLAYAAYNQPWLDAAARGDLAGMLSTFTGLHPPLYAALFGLVDALWGAPAAWLGLSVLLSWGAVVCVGRAGGAWAALVLAVDPLQLAYCAEVNNYPLLCFLIALCCWQRERVASGAPSLGLTLAGVAAGWAHLLGGLFAGLCALSLLRRDRGSAIRVLLGLALGCAPVLVGAWRLATREGTYGQAGADFGVLLEGLDGKLGPWIWVWGLCLLGVWRRPALGFVTLGVAGGALLAMALGVAAPHQQPYWLALGPGQALLLAALPRGLALGAGALGLALFAHNLDLTRALREDLARPRAIDLAWEQAEADDAFWLLAPGLEPDDDKTATSDVLWRLPLWGRAPAWRGPGGRDFEYTDYGWGQPRVFAGHVVHSSTDLWPEQLDAALAWHLSAGRRVWLLLYNYSPAYDYEGKLERALRPYVHRCAAVGEDRGLGQDRMCLVERRR